MSLLAAFPTHSEAKHHRDMPVALEILTVVAEIKKHMSEQKKIRDEFNSVSTKPLDSLVSELAELQSSVSSVSSGLRRQNVQASHLSEEALRMERNFGMIQRAPDTIYNFSQDTSALSEYFNKCVSSYGTRIQTYKKEIQAIEELLSSRARASLTPKELAEVLRKLDEQFISLAAQLYTAKEEMTTAKTQFLRNYRSNNGDKLPISFSVLDKPLSSSAFDQLEKDFIKSQSVGMGPYGPSPFATSMAAAPAASSVVVSTAVPVLNLPTTTASTFPGFQAPVISSTSLFPSSAGTNLKSTAAGGFSLSASQANKQPTAPFGSGFTFGSTVSSSTSPFATATMPASASLFGTATPAFGGNLTSFGSTAAGPFVTQSSAIGSSLGAQQTSQPSNLFGTPVGSAAGLFGAPVSSGTGIFGAPASVASPFGGKSIFGTPK